MSDNDDGSGGGGAEGEPAVPASGGVDIHWMWWLLAGLVVTNFVIMIISFRRKALRLQAGSGEEVIVVTRPPKKKKKILVSEELLEKLAPSSSFEGEPEACAVCLDEMEEGIVVRKLPCEHMFHSNCVETWLRRTNICPSCRYELQILKPDEEEIDLENPEESDEFVSHLGQNEVTGAESHEATSSNPEPTSSWDEQRSSGSLEEESMRQNKSNICASSHAAGHCQVPTPPCIYNNNMPYMTERSQ